MRGAARRRKAKQAAVLDRRSPTMLAHLLIRQGLRDRSRDPGSTPTEPPRWSQQPLPRHYALNAFHVSAVGFLSEPVDHEQPERTLRNPAKSSKMGGNEALTARRRPTRPVSFRDSTSWRLCAPISPMPESSWSAAMAPFPTRAGSRAALPPRHRLRPPNRCRRLRIIPAAPKSPHATAGAPGPG